MPDFKDFAVVQSTVLVEDGAGTRLLNACICDTCLVMSAGMVAQDWNYSGQ
jgi:hypothetical protein